MSLSRKIFLAIFGVSTLSSLVVCLSLYSSTKAQRKREFISHYQHRVQLLGQAFHELEHAYDGVALNAARALVERDARLKRPLSGAELRHLARELGVSNIYVADASGSFVRSTDGNENRNLFSFCPDYSGLYTGKTDYEQTPAVPDNEHDGAIYKYTMVPTLDRKRVIDVSVHIDFVSRVVQEMIDSDNNVNEIEFYSPSGQRLGRVEKSGYEPADLAAANARLPVDGEEWLPNQMIIARSVPASIEHCCECRVKKLVPQDKDGVFSYRLIAAVSYNSFNETLRSLQSHFAIAFALMTLFSALVSRLVSRMLIAKLKRITRTVERVSESGDFAKAEGLPEGPAGSRDEADRLAAQFNRMFTVLRESQGRLIEAERTEARAVVAAQVAHDIRSPLTSMTISLSQLQGHINRAKQTQSVEESFSTLKSGIERVTGIVKKLSATYGQKAEQAGAPRVETPRLTLVDKLFLDVALEHQVKAPRPGMLAVKGFGESPSAWAVVQVTEIQSALSNLLNNAVEAVHAETGRVELSLAREERGLVMKIADNGVGIAPENLGRIFERQWTSGKKEGSGLGLFQAKAAIEWCGGTLGVESAVGRGTTFTVTIPLEKAPSWFTTRVAVPRGGKIVFVDDDPSILALWRSKMRKAEGVTAEYLEVFVGFGPSDGDALVIDQHLNTPGARQTGLDLIAQLSPEVRAAKKAYLCTSEFDDPKIQDRVKALGAWLIPKPCLPAVELEVT